MILSGIFLRKVFSVHIFYIIFPGLPFNNILVLVELVYFIFRSLIYFMPDFWKISHVLLPFLAIWSNFQIPKATNDTTMKNFSKEYEWQEAFHVTQHRRVFWTLSNILDEAFLRKQLIFRSLISLCTQSECGKILTRKTPSMDTFHTTQKV